MPKLALTGGAYQARSVIASAQRSLNLYGEPMPQGQGEQAPEACYPTPGLRLLTTLPKGPVRAIKQVTTGGIYAVGGDTVYRLDPTTWTSTAVGTITGYRPYPVSMQDNGNTLVIVDGTTNGWTVDLGSNAFAAINDPAFYGADRVDYLDTYLLFNKPNTPQFYSSDSLATTFDSLYFANKESFSDLLITLAVAKREIWLFGERTTEIWYNSAAEVSGTVLFPFQEIQSVFVDHGCRAKYSVATYDDAVYWLSYDRAGQGIVLSGAGYLSKRISTYAIEAELTKYSRIDDAIGMVYSLGGHVFYVLTFPTADHTWVYDITSPTGQWHEWLWIDDNGDEHRHRANCMYAVNGTVVAGDWENGNLYAVENTALSDNGQPIKRQRAYPHIVNELDRVFYRQFLADIETGNPGEPPVVTTSIQTIITWPPQIAYLAGPPTALDTVAAPDWQRGFVYFFENGYWKYAAQIVTQPTPLASITTAASNTYAAAVDPLSGDLLVQRRSSSTFTANGEPVIKLDPNTFATLGSFGVSTSFPSYPNAVWVGQEIVCIVCNGVSYGLLKYSEFSGEVVAWRNDTMQHAGFAQAVVSGSFDNRGTMCAGASGGSAATAFLSWDSTTPPEPTIPLYAVTITAGAETYDPASWPATNPHISARTVGTVAAGDVDPTQPGIMIESLGYDHADGNILMWVGTGPVAGTPTNYWIIKLRASDAAVLWTLQVDNGTRISLERSRINGALWVYSTDSFGRVHTSWRIDTVLGSATTQPFGGTFNNLPGYPMFDSENTLMLYAGSFTAGTNSPVPVSGTGNGSGWFIMGGDTKVVSTATAQTLGNLIWLDWSDDRGHSFGNPVSQTFGPSGNYLQSVQWQRLGYARDRVFRLTWSEPTATALQGAYIEVSKANS